MKSMSKQNAMQSYVQLADSLGLNDNASSTTTSTTTSTNAKSSGNSGGVGAVISRLALTDDDIDAAADRKRDLCFFVSLGDMDEVTIFCFLFFSSFPADDE